MKQRILLLLTTAWAVAGHSATITYVGSVEGAQVSDWRTAAVPKTYDIDGDNVLGSTLGAVHWTQVATGEVAPGAGYGWSYQGERTYGQFISPAYATINNLSGIGNGPAGIAAVQWPGEFYFGLEGQSAYYAGKTVRIGVMADVLSAAEWASDFGKTFWLTGPAGATSPVVSPRNGAAGNGVLEMCFFDISDITAGDVFTMHADGPAGVQPGYIGPMCWDIAVIPEPTSPAILGLGAVALALARRRSARQ